MSIKNNSKENGAKEMSHLYFSCLLKKVMIRKPTMMREKLPSSGCLSMLKRKMELPSKYSSMSQISFTSDDLFYGDPLSLSPIKPSALNYEIDESILLGGNFLERGLKELEEMKKEHNETKRLIAINEDLNQKIKEAIQRSEEVQYSTQEKKEIIKEHFGSDFEQLLDSSDNHGIHYSDYRTKLVDEYLTKEIAKFFLVDVDLLTANTELKEEIPVLNKSSVDSMESMKNLLGKLGIAFNFCNEHRKECFKKSFLPSDLMNFISYNMEKCLHFIDSKVDEFTEVDLLETILFLMRTYLSIKILCFQAKKSFNILDVLSFGEVPNLIHRLLERMEQEFPSLQEKLLLSILHFLNFEKLDTSNVSTLIETFFTPLFSHFISSRAWTHHSLLVNKLFKNLLLVILTRVTNNPIDISQIVKGLGEQIESEIFLKTMEYTNKTLVQEMTNTDCSFKHIYMIYNIYHLLVACFSNRNHNTLPLLSNNKEIAKQCKSHFQELSKHLKTLIGVEYTILIGMRFEVFLTSLLPRNDNIL